MTNLEALKAKVAYPLSDNAFKVALIDRDLSDSLAYTPGQAFDLAYADVIMTLIASPNTSEGGYSVSLSDRARLIELANGIYAKYGLTSPLEEKKPTAKFVQRW